MTGDVPERIGHYMVSHSLGSGGMGEVFLAYSPAGSPVAVKVIRSDRLDEHARARFEREALIARTVIGTNRVARFLEANPYADRPWLAMEYVPGPTLLHHVDDEGVLPLPLVASLGALLTEGLVAVHAVGLLHRDLKAQNVILGDDGPMIIDFGLAAFVDSSQDTLTKSGGIIGTVRCMPPEQAGGPSRVTAAADVYALGTVLLYAAAGHYPYDGVRWQAIAAQVANPAIAPDLQGVPEELAPLIEAMLSHEPDARPTVPAVTSACLALLEAASVTPADARRALIGRTIAADAGRRLVPAPSPSLERRLDDRSPSDRGPLDGTDEDAPEIEEAVDRTSAEAAASAPRQRRPPAARRVAEELRAAYAVQSTL